MTPRRTKLSPQGERATPLPPILFAATNSTERRRLADLKNSGRIRAVGPRLYVSVPENETASTLRNAWSTVVATLFPNALLSHRTALEFKPSPEGDVFITSSTNRHVQYPGLTLHFVRGPEALPDDPRFLSLRASSLARAMLENLSTRSRGRVRTVPRDMLEARLEQDLHLGGEAALEAIRDRAREIADTFGWRAQFRQLDGLIGTLLGTREEHVSSPLAKARAIGEPFDAVRVERLSVLFGELRTPLVELPDTFEAPDHPRNKAFIEAYFSNYIEGTTFDITEAEEIVFDKRIPATRPKDAHDILGTFELVSDAAEMRRTPETFESLLDLLRSRHARMLERRPEAEPGVFKSRPNRAGDTEFVHPDYVRGTLRKGFEMYQGVRTGLPRAIFMMFLIAEVHPFVDGNGRTARIMMNAELSARGLTTIIIPTVYRDDYLSALRALSRRDRPAPLVTILLKAHRFSHLEFSPYPVILNEITKRNWFREPDDARIVVD